MDSADLADAARANTDFKRVLVQTRRIQATVMHMEAGTDIGRETHAGYDQTVHVVEGNGIVDLGHTIHVAIGPASVVLIPGGMLHNVRNTHPTAALKLVVLYAPPKFPADGAYRTRAQAEAAD
jgi:mannose-6-phosphate isomerase-like protein (cupin superfamily)